MWLYLVLLKWCLEKLKSRRSGLTSSRVVLKLFPGARMLWSVIPCRDSVSLSQCFAPRPDQQTAQIPMKLIEFFALNLLLLSLSLRLFCRRGIHFSLNPVIYGMRIFRLKMSQPEMLDALFMRIGSQNIELP